MKKERLLILNKLNKLIIFSEDLFMNFLCSKKLLLIKNFFSYSF